LCWGPGCWVEEAFEATADALGEVTGNKRGAATTHSIIEHTSESAGKAITDNPVADHTGIDANVCALGCVGLTYLDGHFYFNRGVGALGALSVGPTYYSSPLSSCTDNPNLTAMAGPISGSINRDTTSGGLGAESGWTFGGEWSPKSIFSLWLGPMWQTQIS
jgi:hypothetical protein